MNQRFVASFACSMALFVSAVAWAAPQPVPTVESLRAKINRSVRSGASLKGFYDDLIAAYGGAAVKPLIQIAQDRGNDDQTRWAALFGLARVAGKHSEGVIRKFMTDSSWMLRDAALKTAAAIDAKDLSPQIERRLKDEALAVRTTAVDVIGHMKLTQYAPKLVDELFDPVNFHGGKALWIHQHILQVIGDFHYMKAAPKLVDLLAKSGGDPELRGHVTDTLKTLTGKDFSSRPFKEQIYLWRRNTLSEEEI